MTKQALTVDVGSNACVMGRRSDDGTDFIAEVYFVEAFNEYGDRWRHVARFPAARVERDDELNEVYFIDVRAQAKRLAERLAERVRAGSGELDMAYWHLDRPVYGSRAYQAYGAADDLLVEKEEG